MSEHYLDAYPDLVIEKDEDGKPLRATCTFADYRRLASYDGTWPTGPRPGRVWKRRILTVKDGAVHRVKAMLCFTEADPKEPEKYILNHTVPLTVLPAAAWPWEWKVPLDHVRKRAEARAARKAAA